MVSFLRNRNMDRRREIFIKINELSETIEILKEIKSKEAQMRSLFEQYDKLSLEENKIYENWSNYLEDIFSRMDYVRL